MPLYNYLCENCGEFRDWRPMRESGDPVPCPACGESAARLISAPYIATLDSAKRRAMAKEERSAYEPEVVQRRNVPHMVDRGRRENHGSHPRKYHRARGSYPWTVGH